MIDTLNEYIARSLPEYGMFSTNINLRKKVDEEGRFLPFRGNTAVFLLREEDQQFLRELQEHLYLFSGRMLAEKLDSGKFHMTLHDLENSFTSGPELEQRMEGTAQKAQALLNRWKDLPPLHMRATWLFNMMHTSVVLGMEPADQETERQLSHLYMEMEDVVKLGYALTPHITIAYYRPGFYDQEQLLALKGSLRPVDWEVEIPMENLVLQNFEDMNHYETVSH